MSTTQNTPKLDFNERERTRYAKLLSDISKVSGEIAKHLEEKEDVLVVLKTMHLILLLKTFCEFDDAIIENITRQNQEMKCSESVDFPEFIFQKGVDDSKPGN